MRGGTLPPALLFAALGLALSFAPRTCWVPSVITLGVALLAFSLVPIPQRELEIVFMACWLSVAATAASVHLIGGLNFHGALALSLNAAVWASAVGTVSGSHLDLLMALPCILLFVPGSWLVARRFATPLKVVSSWVIAVAVLAITLQLLPLTVGYQPDHME